MPPAARTAAPARAPAPSDPSAAGELADDPWLAGVLRRKLVALDDVAHAGNASITFARADTEQRAALFLDALAADAERAGFVTARVPVFEARAFDALDGLVRAVGRALRDGAMGAHEHGVVALLERFREREGEGAAKSFAAAAEREGFYGDLRLLCEGYFAARKRAAQRDAARIDAWLAGTDLSRADEGLAGAELLRPVTPETARRALAELTLLARCVGARGTVLLFEGAEVLARLPAARRERAYVVLRELVDNADGPRGLRAAMLVVVGREALFEGPRSLRSLPPLASRVDLLAPALAGSLPTPHAPLVALYPPARPGDEGAGPRDDAPARTVPPAPRALDAVRPEELRALVRASCGLPPVDAVVSLSVAHELVDAAIDQLFLHSSHEGSVFAVLRGPYGAGKTHIALHLAARALEAKRPVLRLSVEQLAVDLGAPQRHLHRVLLDAELPLPGRPSALTWLRGALRDTAKRDALLETLEALADEGGDAAPTASKLLRNAKKKGARPARALEGMLSGEDLAEKPSNPNYRRDAYDRLLLWLELLRRREGLAGPVVLIDEAENLFRPGVSRVDRRTALRSLAFYCGGALPGACVVIAMTPEAFARTVEEAPALLVDVAGQVGTLACEDAEMFAKRLLRSRPIDAPTLALDDRRALLERVRALHARVRGPARDPDWPRFVAQTPAQGSPRALVRAAVERLEAAVFAGR